MLVQVPASVADKGQALLHVLRQVNAELSIESALIAIIEGARELFQADWAVIYQRGDRNTYVCPVLASQPHARLELTCQACSVAPVCDQAGLPPTQPFIPRLLEAASRSAVYLTHPADTIEVVLAMPLLRRGQLTGHLVLEHYRPYEYGTEDLRMVEVLAAQAAIAIENASLYRAARQREAEVRALNTNLERIITERTAQLQDMIAELEALDRKREEFLASAAHDLKTPITGIRTNVQLLRRRLERQGQGLGSAGLDDSIARPLAGVESASRRMERLVNELLDVTRTGMDQLLPLSKQPGDLVQIVKDIVEESQRSNGRHELELIATQPTLDGHWDQHRLERVFFNLLDNAVKYAPAGGRIVISVEPQRRDETDWAVVRLQDEGLGIAPEDLPEIFRRFHRGSNVGTIPGTGLGLAYSREVIEQHGGTIEVESELNRGTTFSVWLPVRGA